MGNVIQLKTWIAPERSVERTIRQLAEKSSQVYLLPHAKQRMRERHVTRPEVIECLKKGVLKEALHQEASGDWVGKFSRLIAGQEIDVVAKLQERNENEFVLVITVITV
jgi:hypothetical protein